MKKITKKRSLQIAEAQRIYRQRKKETGAERLQLWLNQDSKKLLTYLSQATGKTQQESVEHAISLAYKIQIEGFSNDQGY